MKKTFGMFISEKRLAKNISLRGFSRMIEISPEYLSKIENNLRTAPKDHVIKKMAEVLCLDADDRELLFDLAAESKNYLSLATDLVEYINDNSIIHNTLRLSKRCEMTSEEWQEIFDYISKKYL